VVGADAKLARHINARRFFNDALKKHQRELVVEGWRESVQPKRDSSRLSV
jgi:hypothetical protein